MISLFRRRVTLLDLLPRYAAWASIEASTKKRYASEVRRWYRCHPGMDYRDITTDHFLIFREWGRGAELEPSSIESTVRVVKAMLRFCRDTQGLAVVPSTGKPLKIPAPQPKSVTLSDMDALYEAAAYARWPIGEVKPRIWWRSYLTIAWYTGLRERDLASGLGPECFLSDHLLYEAAKTKKLHVFPYHPRVWRAKTDMACATPLFGGHSPAKIRAELASLCDLAGIDRITPKRLRVASATQWSIASQVAGALVQGSAIRGVMRSYLDVLEILREASTRFAFPKSMHCEQPRLF